MTPKGPAFWISGPPLPYLFHFAFFPSSVNSLRNVPGESG